MITDVVGVLIMPWKLLASPDAYIFIWLVGYGGLLGPISGIDRVAMLAMIAGVAPTSSAYY